MSNEIHQYVDAERLRTDIENNGRFGQLSESDGRGRTVLTGTGADQQAREHLVTRLQDANLDVRIDEVGNIAGRWVPNTSETTAEPIAAGSHLDSVVEGGIFDGPLGVYAALESVRAMQDAESAPDRPIEVVSFTEEEGGRFSDGVLGSSVASGNIEPEEALQYEDTAGITLASALEDIGFRGTETILASEWDAWLELHIEQSSRLEAADHSTGVVTGITGTVRSHLDIVGEANHAGTTSMDARQDALAAAGELTVAVERIAKDISREHSETAVATVGELSVEPNSINVIPGRVHMGIDIRDVDSEWIDLIVDRIRSEIRTIGNDRHVEISYSEPYEIPPADMDPRCISQIKAAAKTAGVKTLELHSGAGHDTMQISNSTKTGMIFAPSVGGISHSPHEQTAWADCTETTKVLAEALYRLASRDGTT